MTFGEIVASLDSLDEDLTIYASADRPLDRSVPDEATGLPYLLEVYLAKEALEVWSQWREGRKPSLDESVEAIAYYADHDAYIE